MVRQSVSIHCSAGRPSALKAKWNDKRAWQMTLKTQGMWISISCAPANFTNFVIFIGDNCNMAIELMWFVCKKSSITLRRKRHNATSFLSIRYTYWLLGAMNFQCSFVEWLEWYRELAWSISLMREWKWLVSINGLVDFIDESINMIVIDGLACRFHWCGCECCVVSLNLAWRFGGPTCRVSSS